MATQLWGVQRRDPCRSDPHQAEVTGQAFVEDVDLLHRATLLRRRLLEVGEVLIADREVRDVRRDVLRPEDVFDRAFDVEQELLRPRLVDVDRLPLGDVGRDCGTRWAETFPLGEQRCHEDRVTERGRDRETGDAPDAGDALVEGGTVPPDPSGDGDREADDDGHGRGDRSFVVEVEAERAAETVGYPVVLRPSNVLGGRGMEIVEDTPDLRRYVNEAVKVTGKSPLLIDQYLRDAIEVDVDAICDGEDVFVAGVMEHIEEAGVHSGDSACSLPPYTLSPAIVTEMKRQARVLALELGVVGLMNIQFAVKDDTVYLIEVNPRASRTVPFVAKAVGLPVANIAAKVMAGRKLSEFDLTVADKGQIAVKEAVFPWGRFPGIDIVLGPEMKSTGEVMGIDRDFATAYTKAQIAEGSVLPQSGTVFVSVKDSDKAHIVEPVRALIDGGFKIIATGGTQKYLTEQGLAVELVNKVAQGRPHVVDKISDGEVALVFNTTDGAQAIRDSFSIRQTTLSRDIPYYTTIAGARAAVQAIAALRGGALEVAPLQSYFEASF